MAVSTQAGKKTAAEGFEQRGNLIDRWLSKHNQDP